MTNDLRTCGCKWRWLQKGLGTDDLDHLLLPWAVSRPIIQRWRAEQHIHYHCHIPSQSPHHNHQKCHSWALTRAWEGRSIYLSNSNTLTAENQFKRNIANDIHDVITHPIICVVTATVIDHPQCHTKRTWSGWSGWSVSRIPPWATSRAIMQRWVNA